MIVKTIHLRWPVKQVEPQMLELELSPGRPLFELNIQEADKLKLTDAEKDDASFAANNAAIDTLLIVK